jgi:hypothetical protein
MAVMFTAADADAIIQRIERETMGRTGVVEPAFRRELMRVMLELHNSNPSPSRRAALLHELATWSPAERPAVATEPSPRLVGLGLERADRLPRGPL